MHSVWFLLHNDGVSSIIAGSIYDISSRNCHYNVCSWNFASISPAPALDNGKHHIKVITHLNPFNKHKLRLILAWINSQMPCKVWDRVSYSFPNFTCQIFQREHKHIFTFCVISPHWYDADSWNPSSNTTRTYLFYIVNIMAADVLAT